MDMIYEQGYKQAMKDAVWEIMEWRELKIRAFRTTKTTDPDSSRRECQNTLNLLDTIITKLRKLSGEDPAHVFQDMRTWDKVDYP